MRLPPDIAAAIRSGHDLGFSCRADGTVSDGFEAGWGGGAYPPPGHLPWNILDVGNGDTYGYYWPIGREDGPPIVCTLMHDAWELLPVASSLAGCLRLLLVTNHGDVEQLVDTARAFGVEIGDIAIPASDRDEAPASLDGPPWTDAVGEGIEFWGAPSAGELLRNDPDSPHLRVVAAREAVATRQLDEAEDHLRVALAGLPEYADALALLAQVYRQQQNRQRTAETLMEAITSPRCFGAPDRTKLIEWLRRLPDDACGSCADPLWRRRHGLTFAAFEELIEEYHRLGMGVRAVRLRILGGEMMGRETVSSRERHDWTEAEYQSRLRADLERAGLHARLAAVGRVT